MIKVNVESYCQDCEEFKPRCHTSVGYRDDKDGDVLFAGRHFRREVITSIYCRHRDKCRGAVVRAREIIEEEVENEILLSCV